MPATAALLHPTALRPWQPLSDAEWDAIRPYLPDPARGGRPSDRRRTVDAIFWIAASKEPWKSLPSHLGKPGSVSTTLRRWARAGILERLLIAVSNHPLSTDNPHLRRLTWLIARAFRRMARILPLESVMLARDLARREKALLHALPAAPWFIPDLPLFTRARAMLAEMLTAARPQPTLATFERIRPGLRAATALLGLGAGRWRAWRLK
ncbi:MAG TPA: transposase [Acetobacteraceae bacterium]|nr:transposase [Acetobacteraceae bacterium]